MARGGSKKGEHRGNAKPSELRRPAAPKKATTKARTPRKRAARSAPSHETPNDVMHDAITQPRGNGRRPQQTRTIEHRIELSRVILGDSGKVRDMTPKDVILDNMHYFMQAAFDWQGMLVQLAGMTPTAEMPQAMINAAIEKAENEIAMARNVASEHAHKIAPFIHSRLAAFKLVGGNDDNPDDIVNQLLDDIDQRSRTAKVIGSSKGAS